MTHERDVPRKRRRQAFTERPRLVNLKHASEPLGVPYSSLRAQAGIAFPIIRIGRLVYAEWKDLDAWIESLKEREAPSP